MRAKTFVFDTDHTKGQPVTGRLLGRAGDETAFSGTYAGMHRNPDDGLVHHCIDDATVDGERVGPFSFPVL